MSERLDGKVAVVTGASSGIGAETAKLFAQNAAEVVLVARNEKNLSSVLGEIHERGGNAIAISADVGMCEDCERAIEETVRQFGRLDILVNDAGMADKHRPISRTDNDWWHEVCRVNQDSIFICAVRHFATWKNGAVRS